ncbi:MAG: hypothetical protein OEZ25_04540 [Candidatus Bathyarchaeota archaeon]|nr:hypothetical protein [Candidatus Bathyarchaeota archaeon]
MKDKNKVEGTLEDMENEVLKQVEKRKKARLRTRGPYRKAHIEPHAKKGKKSQKANFKKEHRKLK